MAQLWNRTSLIQSGLSTLLFPCTFLLQAQLFLSSPFLPRTGADVINENCQISGLPKMDNNRAHGMRVATRAENTSNKGTPVSQETRNACFGDTKCTAQPQELCMKGELRGNPAFWEICKNAARKPKPAICSRSCMSLCCGVLQTPLFLPEALLPSPLLHCLMAGNSPRLMQV